MGVVCCIPDHEELIICISSSVLVLLTSWTPLSFPPYRWWAVRLRCVHSLQVWWVCSCTQTAVCIIQVGATHWCWWDKSFTIVCETELKCPCGSSQLLATPRLWVWLTGRMYCTVSCCGSNDVLNVSALWVSRIAFKGYMSGTAYSSIHFCLPSRFLPFSAVHWG